MVYTTPDTVARFKKKSSVSRFEAQKQRILHRPTKSEEFFEVHFQQVIRRVCPQDHFMHYSRLRRFECQFQRLQTLSV
jgi:hypothetical protein